MLCVLKAAFAWLVLTLVGINLIGYVVRGFFPPALPTDTSEGRLKELLASEARRFHAANNVMTLVGIVLTAAYLFALYRYWNVALAIAAVLVMVSRLPDLLWEIKTGTKVTQENAPQSVIYYVGQLLWLLALPLTWYSLCGWKQ